MAGTEEETVDEADEEQAVDEADEEAVDQADEEQAVDEADEEERTLEKLKTEAVQQVVDVGFPLTRDAALEVAGHRRVEVGDATLTVNMILSKLRGDDWRTGTDFRNAIERAWDDIQESYL